MTPCLAPAIEAGRATGGFRGVGSSFLILQFSKSVFKRGILQYNLTKISPRFGKMIREQIYRVPIYFAPSVDDGSSCLRGAPRAARSRAGMVPPRLPFTPSPSGIVEDLLGASLPPSDVGVLEQDDFDKGPRSVWEIVGKRGACVDLFIKEASRIPLLTHTEERDLANLRDQGEGRIATGRFVESNARLVVRVAYQYWSISGRRVPLADLIQEGNLGLMEAAEKFDQEKGNRFATYAIWWIRQFVCRALIDQSGPVRIPIHAGEMVKQIAKKIRLYEERKGSSPSPDQLRELLVREGVYAEETVGAMLDVIYSGIMHPESIDRRISDMIPDKQDPHAEVYAREVGETVWGEIRNRLPQRGAVMLLQRYGIEPLPDQSPKDAEDRTLQEVGEAHGVSRERVRQIIERGFETLRRSGVLRRLAQEEFGFDPDKAGLVDAQLNDTQDLPAVRAKLKELTDSIPPCGLFPETIKKFLETVAKRPDIAAKLPVSSMQMLRYLGLYSARDYPVVLDRLEKIYKIPADEIRSRMVLGLVEIWNELRGSAQARFGTEQAVALLTRIEKTRYLTAKSASTTEISTLLGIDRMTVGLIRAGLEKL